MPEDDALRAANLAYYRAFALRDAEAMARIWAQEGVSCVHPGWPPIFGREAILASYRDIFKNPFQEEIEARAETLIRADNDGRVVCLERVGEALLVATNWFRRIDSDWRLVHHQASPLSAGSAKAKTPSTRH